MERPRTKKKKNPYRPPKLVRYGDLRRLTRTQVKGGTANDGGGNPPTRV